MFRAAFLLLKTVQGAIMASRCSLILMSLTLTVACSPDESESDRSGITSEDAQMLDKAAAQLDDETDPDQNVSSRR